jgi:alkylation response protein AidB-like acyl-CoA dehydrogenase
MAEYTPPVFDIAFALTEIAGLGSVADFPGFSDFDMEMLEPVLEECGRFIADTVAPLNRNSDLQGSVHGANDAVVTPDGFTDAYAAWVESGWGSIPFDPAYGGGGFPSSVATAVGEMLNSACMAFALCPLLTQGGIDLLAHHGTEEQKELWLSKLVAGSWTATMNLTEPDAGSDVGALRTRAERADDGTYRISGQKIFITYGEHDMVDNIVHLVLARTADAPPGTKGISTFIVPKFLLDDDGNPTIANDLRCTSIEHKLGIHGSPTCVMQFGENDGAIGYLIGEENRGMEYMFTMMNNARLAVGAQGLAISERAYQDAVDYARERTQGRAVGAAPGTASPIIEHPDVRRNLMTMRAYIEAMRGLCYLDAAAVDQQSHHPDEDGRAAGAERAALLTPIVKSWCTDLGCELTSIAVQIHGGMGFVEETGVAQHMRDARINPIYEGTNGIQALDLVARKLPLRGGEAIAELVAEMRTTASEATGSLEPLGVALTAAVDSAEATTKAVAERLGSSPLEAFAGATPYLNMLGHVVGGWVMVRQAQAAQRRIDAGATDPRLAAKVTTASFYCEQLLPKAQGFQPAALAGSADLMALGAEQF